MNGRSRGIVDDLKGCNMKLSQISAMLGQRRMVLQDTKSYAGRDDSDLSTLFLDSVQACAIGRLGEATVEPGLLIILVSQTQPLRAIIEGITKWFVDAS